MDFHDLHEFVEHQLAALVRNSFLNPVAGAASDAALITKTCVILTRQYSVSTA